MNEEQRAQKGLNILCIDGGGIHGLSSLFVIEELMNRLHGLEQGETRPKPADYFDVIAGTGTGGIIACMLGRLRMSIGEAIGAYLTLAKHAFAKKYISVGRPTAYRGNKLQEALSSMVLTASGREADMMKVEGLGESACKTMVFAMSSHNLTGAIPVLFRSYDTPINSSLNCTIWEALYATMAHPDLFKAIYIADGLISQSFIGGELGCSNPTAHVLDEVKNIYPDRQVSCIISIGAGLTHIVRIPDPSPSERILRTSAQVVGGIRNMSSDSERVAEEMAARFKHTQSVYYRFNVDQGIQMVEDDWEERHLAKTYTSTYMKKAVTTQALNRAAQAVKERKPMLSVKCVGQWWLFLHSYLTMVLIAFNSGTRLDGSIQTSVEQTIIMKECPTSTPVFTGRENQLQQVRNCIAGNTSERRVCVVYGMGGAGKTQLTLKAIERNREIWKHILYVDATSKEAIEGVLGDFAMAEGIGKTFKDALGWLASCIKPWLLVLDNADHPSLDVHQYFPDGDRGSILITTRRPALAKHALGPGSTCHVSGMSETDALALFFKVARIQPSRAGAGETEAAHALLKEFGYLAFAIVQAGAYIAYSVDTSISQYLQLFRERGQQMLEQYVKLRPLVKLYDYERSVYTTFKLCYDLLEESGDARPTLWLICYLHRDDIRQDIFRRAATKVRSYSPQLKQTSMEQEAVRYMQGYLGRFLDSDGNWDSTRFSKAMNELTSYSLVELDSPNQAYRMHILVQDWARTSNPQAEALAVECCTLLLSLAVDWLDTSESLTFTRSLRRHLDEILPKQSKQLGANHAGGFGLVSVQNGNWHQAEELQTQLVGAARQEFGEEHPNTLASMHNLAATYQSLGQLEKAQSLQEQVLTARKRVLGEEHPETLTSMNNLANTYKSRGQWDKAQSLQEQAMNARKRVLGEEHPDMLMSMSNLAVAYQSQGQWDKAQSLQEQVLNLCKRVLGEEHPQTLTSVHNLALTYKSRGQCDKAQSLQEQVLDARKRVLGEEHPETLTSMNNLALTYRSLSQWDKAKSLQEQAMHSFKRVLGGEHPDTLTSMNNLAITYWPLGQWDKAQSLQQQSLDARKRVLGEEHPDTLASMGNLALMYEFRGQWDEAQVLHEQVLEGRKRVLGEEHPDTLRSMAKLSMAYAQTGRLGESEHLAAAVDARQHILGEQHEVAVWARERMNKLRSREASMASVSSGNQ